MSKQPFRTATGGLIDRGKTLTFRFDGKNYTGHPGDTLASALVANRVRLVGRSFKYHRPRGILTAGCAEPNALVTLGEDGSAEPNTRATVVELFDGLTAMPQNGWPSINFDIGAINNLLFPFFPSGFYYKTFMGGPKGAWTRLYEPFIRRMAGLGPAPTMEDPDFYDKRHATCDILVVGAGPAGLAAASAAAAGGARVTLIDEQAQPGGSLLASAELVDGKPALEWASHTAADFASKPDTRLLIRTTAFGVYDHGLVMALERLTDHCADKEGPRQRLWQIRTQQIILATGAHEQPLLFENNDLPNIMLAGAGQTYAQQYGALVGRRVAIATNNDSAYKAAKALSKAGADIVAIIDNRADTRIDHGIDAPVLEHAALVKAHGRKAVHSIEVASANGTRHRFDCDAVLMSSGWQPAVHLHCHTGGQTQYDQTLGCFIPKGGNGPISSVGGCTGRFSLADCLGDGHKAGLVAAKTTGYTAKCTAPTAAGKSCSASREGFQPPLKSKSFVDFQNDVTTADVALAAREGFISVEHLKRYTTTGMATDQGKLSNLNAIVEMSRHLNILPGDVGTTTFRPPYTPVTFGALAGLDRGDLMDPIRKTPMHEWHVAQGAVFEDVGQWKRPWYYLRNSETMDEAVRRECRTVRANVGMLDASTLGKIDIQGPDTAEFLNLVYTNAWLKLPVGRCRYGVMCRDDGMVMDDGVTIRIDENRYLMTTTTGNAALVMDHLEDLLQTEWPHLKVYLTSVTDHWAASVVTGPKARDMLAAVAKDVDLSTDAFPHLSMREARIGTIPVHIYRISFTGELSYEVHVAAQYGRAVWEALYAAGQPFGVTEYGTETMHVLRAEKGYIIIGQETDGTVTPYDLGLDWAVSTRKEDFVGKRSLSRTDTARHDRKQLVGLVPQDGKTIVEEGAQLTESDGVKIPVPMVGHVTSSYWSVAGNGPIALALLAGGRERHGETVYARYQGHTVPCKVTKPVFYDMKGERLNG